jgi:hypothetical protein
VELGARAKSSRFNTIFAAGGNGLGFDMPLEQGIGLNGTSVHHAPVVGEQGGSAIIPLAITAELFEIGSGEILGAVLSRPAKRTEHLVANEDIDVVLAETEIPGCLRSGESSGQKAKTEELKFLRAHGSSPFPEALPLADAGLDQTTVLSGSTEQRRRS